MAVDGISDFIASNNAVRESATKKNNRDLSMVDFFQLMVAQLQNQDMFSPMDNSQFMSQMAQFSMVNALMDMSELTSVSYSTSLIGKEATVAFIGSDGQMGSKTGIIEAVNLFNGQAEVVIGGDAFSLSNVMTVNGASAGAGNALLEQSGIIGRFASALHVADDGSIETLEGVVAGLKLADDEVYALIGGKYCPVSEIVEMKAAEEGEGGDAEGA
jgi:flagellar basal-body rod modification protein FlgD